MTERSSVGRAAHFKGLTTAEVEASLREFGSNELTPPKRDPWWVQFLEKFEDPIIRILIVAAFIALLVGYFEGTYAEGFGILTAILLATLLAFLNEYKANQEFDLLNRVSEGVPVKVIRNDGFLTVPRKDLVRGDIVFIDTGDEIPADADVLEAVSLQIDESKLTGESHPVTKCSQEQSAGAEKVETTYSPDRAVRGSMVVDGHGVLRVTAVGDSTEIGKTARSASEELDEETPLQNQLGRLSKVIGVIGFGIAVLNFAALVSRGLYTGDLSMNLSQGVFSLIFMAALAIGLSRIWLPIVNDGFELAGAKPPGQFLFQKGDLHGWLKTVITGIGIFIGCLILGMMVGFFPTSPREWLNAKSAEELLHYFMIAVTIIVVAVPEGLAMSVTISLAYSVRKMTAANNLVRRMHACETIGAATVICSDKTGTLTMNQMKVAEAPFPVLAGKTLPKELLNGGEVLIAESLAVNGTANLSRLNGEATVSMGNPTEGAILMWLEELGINYLPIREKFSIFRQWAFSTERKFMGTVGVSPATNKMILHIKGAPEIILAKCSNLLVAEGVKPLKDFETAIHESLKSFQVRGMRTLGFAFLENPADVESKDIVEVAKKMTWLGFLAIADPLRPEVPAAFKACWKAGVDIKIVTGDTSETALEIARQTGLWKPDDPSSRHITGEQFQKLPDDEAGKVAEKLKVMSRARSMDKLRLVQVLKKRGSVVAVTGDGTNDAPALNHANVGLAMGKTGTAVAKEASDIILLDDSFPSIVNGILWGRSLYENIQRFILFQLTINVAALGIALMGPFIGVKLPLTVIQMLWVNLIMDTFAALALATEPPHEEVMNRPPRKPEDFIVTPPMQRQIIMSACIFLAVLLWLLLTMKFNDGVMEPREESIFFNVFILLQFWNMFNARCLGLNQSAFAGITQNKSFLVIAVTILLGQFFIVQFGGSVFRTVPLSLKEWVCVFLATSPVLLIGELVRYFRKISVQEKQAS